MTISQINKRESPLWHIVEYLQRSGSATIKELEDLLGVTTTAVRQHLTTLQVEGYIERRVVHSGVGRPHHAYFTTAKVQELFACQCDDLALTLLQEVFHLEGQERALQLLDRVGTRLARKYSPSIHSSLLQERVSELAGTLNGNGVLADSRPQEDNTILLRTYNCPFHELAHEHREICEMDTNMMRKVLGSDVSLTSCMLDGHAGCTFVVKASNAQDAGAIVDDSRRPVSG
jgi:DeoR family transcriptional regulator, suf operon transcriptional repressor